MHTQMAEVEGTVVEEEEEEEEEDDEDEDMQVDMDQLSALLSGPPQTHPLCLGLLPPPHVWSRCPP